MTDTHTSPAYAALAEGLQQALDALRSLGALAPQLDGQARLTTRYTLAVSTDADVNEIAAEADVTPEWVTPWTYAAEWAEGTVTVTVSFSTDPLTAPATAATIDSFCRMAASAAPGSAA